MKRGIKKFGLNVAIVLILVAAVDVVIGKTMDSLLPQISNQGATGKTYFSLNEVNTPIAIVGSSRAAHHYVTQMVEDSISMPTYNVARDGCFFSYNCCVVNSILDRYSPKLIIWENSLDYLYDGVEDPLENLYPYYLKNEWISKALKEELTLEEYVRLSSNLYKYNSTIHRILMRYFSRNAFVNDTQKGYFPLMPKVRLKPLELLQEKETHYQLSEKKIERFRATLIRARDKHVKLVIVDSPKYKISNPNNSSAKMMQKISDECGALFIDDSQLPEILEHVEYFNDAGHMNDDGAKVYTEIFLSQIKEFALSNR